jgi:hypothetical protein
MMISRSFIRSVSSVSSWFSCWLAVYVVMLACRLDCVVFGAVLAGCVGFGGLCGAVLAELLRVDYDPVRRCRCLRSVLQ